MRQGAGERGGKECRKENRKNLELPMQQRAERSSEGRVYALKEHDHDPDQAVGGREGFWLVVDGSWCVAEGSMGGEFLER